MARNTDNPNRLPASEQQNTSKFPKAPQTPAQKLKDQNGRAGR